MKLGLDCDGVVVDSGKLKSEGVKELYGMEIPPEEFKRELLVGSNIFTQEQYTHIQSQIYASRDLGLKMEPVKDAIEYISKLQDEGHELTVITSRRGDAAEIAREWMRAHSLELELVSVGKGENKSSACHGLNCYIDDDLDKLGYLVGVVPHRFLFTWGYNLHVKVPKLIARRVDSWKSFYKEISALSEALKI